MPWTTARYLPGMDSARQTFWATLVVIVTGVFWGFYWLPVRQLEALGMPGAWGTVAITVAAACILAPLVAVRSRRAASMDRAALASVALGGVAFALYSIGFVYGHVAIIVLLWFLTPVWSTLIARFYMGWDTPMLRIWAIGLGLVGLFLMLSAGGEIPIPRGVGEWLALVAGVLWAVATTGIRVRPAIAPLEAAFVFAVGASIAAVALAPFLSVVPASVTPMAAVWAVLTGALWWGPAMALLMWATTKLEPARVGILLMSEVLIGAVSAALIAGEVLSPPEVIGGALVLCAGVLEVWPTKRRAA